MSGPDSRALCLFLGWYAQKRDARPLYSHASHISVALCVHCVQDDSDGIANNFIIRIFHLAIFFII